MSQPAVTPEHLPQVTVFAVVRPDAQRAALGLLRIVTAEAMAGAVIDLPVGMAIVADHHNELEQEAVGDTHLDQVQIAGHQAQDREDRKRELAAPVRLVVPVAVFAPVDPAPDDQVAQAGQVDQALDVHQDLADAARAAPVAPAAVVAAARLLQRTVVRNKSVHHEHVAERATTTRKIATRKSRSASRTRSQYPRSIQCRKRSPSWKSLRYRILLEK